MTLKVFPSFCVLLRHHTERHPRACGVTGIQETRLGRSGPEPEFLLAAFVPVKSCTAPRRRGMTIYQQEDVLYGGFGPDLPCYFLKLLHGSSRFEVDDPHCSWHD